MQEVVVTGMGIVSPIGVGMERFWETLVDGGGGIHAYAWGNEVSGMAATVEEPVFLGEVVDPQRLRSMDRLTKWTLGAAIEAVDGSGLSELPPLRTAVVVGSTMGSVPSLVEATQQLDDLGPRGVPSRLMAQVIPNIPAAHLVLHWNLHGPLLTISTACASSVDAIGQAVRMVANGEVDYALAGGVESLLSPVVYHSLMRARALSRSTNPDLASRPFDRDRDGFVMGEGAGMLLLERRDLAERRQAPIHAVVRGYASLADGFHVTSPEPEGQYEARVMHMAWERSHLTGAVDAVYAHGTSTIVGDAAEIAALKRFFKEQSLEPWVTSIKGHIGHTMAASGVMSAMAAIRSLESGLVVGTLGTRNLDAAIDFPVVKGRAVEARVHTVMVNAFGFGGQNASLVMSGK